MRSSYLVIMKIRRFLKKPDETRNLSVVFQALDKQLPWGTLTGIRPTKIAFDGYEKGESSEESFTDFKRLSGIRRKSKIMYRNRSERERTSKAFPYKEGYSLYIGIPFCPSTCLYCSFTSYSIDQFENIVQDYLEAL